MSFSTEGLARACAVHPKRTVAVWVAAVLVSFVVIAVLLGNALTSDGDVTSNPESKQAAALIRDELPARADSERDRGRALGSLHGRRSRVPGEGAGARRARRGARRRRRQRRATTRSNDQSLVSKDRHATMVPLVMRGDEVAPLVDLVKSAERAGRLPGLDHRLADGRRRLREALRGRPAEGRAADRAARGADRPRCSCSGRSWRASCRCCSGCCRSWSRSP